MARQARIDAPGALHHIIIRGIERKAIFRDDGDRERFLERFESVLVETSTPCYAWALLPRPWAVRELGVSLTDLTRRLGMSPAGVGYAVQRGEVMACGRGYQLCPPRMKTSELQN